MSSYWEQGVWGALNVLNSPCGYAARCVLTEIDYWGKRGSFVVWIVPQNMQLETAIYQQRPDLTDQEKAIKTWLNASATSWPIPGQGKMSDASKNERGTGVSAIVRFDPAEFDPDNAFRQFVDQELTDPKVRGHYGPYGTTPAEVLLHELVHAMRFLKGMNDKTYIDPPINDTVDEFAAVLVTNIHTAERKPAGLRAGHAGFLPMLPSWTTSQGFLADQTNKHWVAYLCHQDPGFCRNLSVTSYVNAWNPIRAFLKP